MLARTGLSDSRWIWGRLNTRSSSKAKFPTLNCFEIAFWNLCISLVVPTRRKSSTAFAMVIPIAPSELFRAKNYGRSGIDSMPKSFIHSSTTSWQRRPESTRPYASLIIFQSTRGDEAQLLGVCMYTSRGNFQAWRYACLISMLAHRSWRVAAMVRTILIMAKCAVEESVRTVSFS